jgi:hypothetical protein
MHKIYLEWHTLKSEWSDKKTGIVIYSFCNLIFDYAFISRSDYTVSSEEKISEWWSEKDLEKVVLHQPKWTAENHEKSQSW